MFFTILGEAQAFILERNRQLEMDSFIEGFEELDDALDDVMEDLDEAKRRATKRVKRASKIAMKKVGAFLHLNKKHHNKVSVKVASVRKQSSVKVAEREEEKRERERQKALDKNAEEMLFLANELKALEEAVSTYYLANSNKLIAIATAKAPKRRKTVTSTKFKNAPGGDTLWEESKKWVRHLDDAPGRDFRISGAALSVPAATATSTGVSAAMPSDTLSKLERRPSKKLIRATNRKSTVSKMKGLGGWDGEDDGELEIEGVSATAGAFGKGRMATKESAVSAATVPLSKLEETPTGDLEVENL
jgi:hypothetical protein